MNKWPLSCNVALALCRNLWVCSSLCHTALLTLKTVLQLSVALAAPSHLPFSPMDLPPSLALPCPPVSIHFYCTAYSLCLRLLQFCLSLVTEMQIHVHSSARSPSFLPKLEGIICLLTLIAFYILTPCELACVCAFPSDLSLFWYKDSVMYLCIPTAHTYLVHVG